MSREWTGGRLDDLNHRVGEGFARVDADLRAVRSEVMTMNARLEASSQEMNARFEASSQEMNARFEAMGQEMNARFEAMQRLIIQVGGGIIATMAIGFFSVIATQLL